MPQSLHPRSSDTHRRVPVCGQATTLPPELLTSALSLADHPNARFEDVEVALRCVLQTHVGGEHHAFVLQLDGPGGGAV